MGSNSESSEWTVSIPNGNRRSDTGRLLLFLKPDHQPAVTDLMQVNSIYPDHVTVVSQWVSGFDDTGLIHVNMKRNVFPAPVTTLSPGIYQIQAVLDRDDQYNHDQGGPGDLFSLVRRIQLPLQEVLNIELTNTVPELDVWEFPGSSQEDESRRAAVRTHMREFTLQSQLLTSFWGQRKVIRAWVLLPDDYRQQTERTWPTVFVLGAYGDTHKRSIHTASALYRNGITNNPPMIWVFLDFQTPNGPTLFADSVNNGPWGSALVDEFIPALEQRYNMDGKPSGRLLFGHSSGGWATVWLQVNHPKKFGGAWATAPDALDFRAFLNTNLYEEGANLYRDDAGRPRAVARNGSETITTIEDSVRLEMVLGSTGGLFRHWEWVFSPRGIDGSPLEMFNRTSGNVNPSVAQYWHDNYDIAYLVSRDWSSLKQDLNGKLHIFVGTQDDHYLDRSVYRLRDVMTGLGADATFVFRQGRTHNDLFEKGDDPLGLFREIAQQMYAESRGS